MVSNQGPVVVSVYPELPVKTLPELIAYGKAQPGKLSYAVDATSGLGVVVGRLLNKRGGIGMVEVPYRTTARDDAGHVGGNDAGDAQLVCRRRRFRACRQGADASR